MSCENCGSCRGGCGLLLTEAELALLRRLGETPFLPIAAAFDRKTPVYLEDPERPREQSAAAIQGLAAKGLLCLDYDIPLKNFDYAAYGDYPLHGSAALTAAGQEAVEVLELQGARE